jgi:integrase
MRRWNWIDKVPKVRVRRGLQETIAALIHAMALPWMRDAAPVAVSTGLRESELFGLTPAHIDLAQRNAWITQDAAKSGRTRSVPLNDDTYAVIERRLRQGERHVFSREGSHPRLHRATRSSCF